MILEDAYNNNPKPDKQARLDIVSRVSLNEKEVQVRFGAQTKKRVCSAHTLLINWRCDVAGPLLL